MVPVRRLAGDVPHMHGRAAAQCGGAGVDIAWDADVPRVLGVLRTEFLDADDGSTRVPGV